MDWKSYDGTFLIYALTSEVKADVNFPLYQLSVKIVDISIENSNKETMEHSDFVVKCYNKQELAQMYFPDLTIRASVNKLRRWMRRCKPLMNEILSTDFHPKTKAFSVREVRLITYYLGKPGEL